jgi:hypothetical protein
VVLTGSVVLCVCQPSRSATLVAESDQYELVPDMDDAAADKAPLSWLATLPLSMISDGMGSAQVMVSGRGWSVFGRQGEGQLTL